MLCSDIIYKLLSNLQELPTENMTKSLTKNQKRKLRKKRRHMAEVTVTSEFTFDPEVKDQCQDSATEERKAALTKEHICAEIKDFLQAIWEIYSKDGKSSLSLCYHLFIISPTLTL